MPHPDIRRPRPAALAGAVGALLLLTVPAGAVLYDEVALTCDAASGTVNALDAILEPTCEAAEEQMEEVVAPVEEAVAPVVEVIPSEVTDPVGEVLAPVAEAAPAPVADVLPGGEETPGGADAETSGSPGSPGGAASSDSGGSSGGIGTSGEDGSVAAAGKDPVEVTEPQGPAAQGRVTGPTFQPTVPGANIAGIGSQSGLTLQPFEATPLVSIPTVLDQPMVAGAPVTMSSPVAAVAASALDFAGDMVLPQTNGQAFLLTAVGLGLVTATGTSLRRRFGGTTTLDVEI